MSQINNYLLNNLLLLLIKVLFFILDQFVPPKKNLIGFGSNSGKLIAGNIKTLFEYFISRSEYECYFLVFKRKPYNNLSKIYGEKIVYFFSLKGVIKLLRTNWFFSSHGPSDFLHLPIEYTTKVFLTWHGKPYKIDGLVRPNLTPKQKRAFRRYSRITAMTTSSPLCKYYFSAAMSIDFNKILPFGYPRDERVIMKLDQPNQNKRINNLTTNILYAPTYRDVGELIWFPFPDRDLQKLNKWLSSNHAMIHLRSHINNSFQEELEQYSHINTFNFDQYSDIYDYLASFDILITDYSSIYPDFLILDRPCIFLDYDYEEFIEYRGVFLPREIISVGDHPISQFELINSLNKAISNPEHASKRRKQVSLLFNEWSNNKSSELIFNYINQDK